MMTTTVCIKTKTWNKDSTDLFDYDNTQTAEQTFEATNSVSVYKSGGMIYLIPDHSEDENSDDQNVFNLKENQGSYSICKTNNTEESPEAMREPIWQVVKRVFPGHAYKGHQLSEGDIVKFGKVMLRIREIHVPEDPEEKAIERKSFNSTTEEETKNEVTDDKGQKSPSRDDFLKKRDIEKMPENELQVNEFTCRICLENEYTEANPFITPCSCSGSVKYIHLDCLKKWISSRCFSKSTEDCSMYMFKDLECELCHQVFPDAFLYEGKEFELVDIERPKTPYIIFETLPQKKDFKKAFYVATVTQNNKEKYLKIGRKNDCQVKINDVSVSRLHALIKFSNKRFLLENGYSKFGTLVLLKNDVPVKKEHELSIQVGRTVLTFQAIEKEVPVQPIATAEAVEPVDLAGEPLEIKFEESPKEKIVPLVEEESKSANVSPAKNLRDKPSYRKLSYCSLDENYPGTVDNLDNFRNSILEIPSSCEEKTFKLAESQSDDYDAQVRSEIERVDRLLESLRGALTEHYKSTETSDGSIKDLRLSQNEFTIPCRKGEAVKEEIIKMQDSKEEDNVEGKENDSQDKSEITQPEVSLKAEAEEAN